MNDELPEDATQPHGARRRRPSVWLVLAVAWLAGLALLTLFAPIIPSIRDPDAKVRIAGKVQAAYKLGPGNTAWWGTDRLGFDVFARCIAYAKNSLTMGFVSMTIGLIVGGTLGIMAGYFRGWVDRVISIIIDCLLAVPALILALMLIQRLDDLKETWSFLGPLTRKWQIILTLSLLAVAPLARIVRAQTMALRDREFVLAARSIGTSNARIIRRELLPNLVPTMVTVAFTGLGILVSAEAALAFLQLGIKESWGYMIEANRKQIDKGWWATLFPCLMLFLTVMSANLIGDRLARRFDTKEASV
ncbi:MAG TPA: ABC transporter permease [Ilumatobacteraceae bacterium]|nr:ABC transporter permease [Ilumatobacteraceae bacterium]